MTYGDKPTIIKKINITCKEMMFYQYLPIKLEGQHSCIYEQRLSAFAEIIGIATQDFIKTFGYQHYVDSYIYLTAKHQYQPPQTSYNRKGWHSDGFLTNDINYIWCDKFPTIFNSSKFNLTPDDKISLEEMNTQAIPSNDFSHEPKTLLRLNQFNIHKVADNQFGDFRTFVKISFSPDKYDLIGNSHNYELDYNWNMKQRQDQRNIPQSIISK
jgi:hypothetical protein